MVTSRTCVLFRHGIAEKAAERGVSDFDRRLTAKGVERTREAARGLAMWLATPVDVLHSPLARATDTAAVIAEVFEASRTPVAALAPGHDPGEMLGSLTATAGERVTVAVGHEPDLGALAGHVIGADGDDWVELKKASACGLSLPTAVEGGSLRWLLPPRVLRELARRPAADRDG